MPWIVAAGTALLVVLIGVAGYTWYRTSENEAAALRFRDAHGIFESGRYEEAAASFQALAQEYPATPSGRLAVLYRAHALARQSKGADAAASYTEYLASSPPADYLRQAALYGLGHGKETVGDPTGARDAYIQAADLAGPYRIDALLSAARLAESAGDADRAGGLYRRLEALNPGPPVSDLLREKVKSEPTAPAAEAAPEG